MRVKRVPGVQGPGEERGIKAAARCQVKETGAAACRVLTLSARLARLTAHPGAGLMMQHVRSGAGQAVSSAMLARYGAVRGRSLRLIDGLSAEDCQIQSMADASPLKWHLAHTTWFFETFVLMALEPDRARFDPHFAQLFNSYYNSVGPMHARPQRGLLTRPSLDTVLAYRAHVDAEVERLCAAAEPARCADLLELGLQHEQQHQELMLADLLHAFSCNPLQPACRDGAPPPVEAQPLQWWRVEAGLRMLGQAGDGFAFDNEQPRHRVWLDAFELASRPVTNAEYRAFIEAGGYRDPLLWLSDGWAQVQAQNWQRPLYWAPALSHAFGLHGLQPLAPQAPVCHLSYFEADAYARWAGASLPTEAQWEVAMGERGWPALPMAGQVWEWTSSAYAAYPGFRPAAGAVGEYNGKFMCGQYVLRGGSCATPPDHARLTYRNFFPPSARWQFSGLRLAREA
jgi:ergothioneine biosynthesis protein EgtB